MSKAKFIIIFLIIFLGVLGVAKTNFALAATFFEFDGESNYQYMGSGNAHPGGGYFNWMGGDAGKPEGTLPTSGVCNYGTDYSPLSYHYTILSNEAAAQGSIAGSQWSLKTPYTAACNNESYQRDTTIITIPPGHKEIYIRWYQKFTGTWQSSTQHKFTKFCQSGHSDDEHCSGYSTFQGPSKVISQDMHNCGNQFGTNKSRMHAVNPGYTVTFSDGYNNQCSNYPLCSGSDSNVTFQTDTWYFLEMHVKLNTDVNSSDGEYDFWINGHLYMQERNFKWFDGTVITDIGNFEMQHLQQNRAANDEPTYMDNIVISDSYIGSAEFSDTTPPAAPSGVTIQ